MTTDLHDTQHSEYELWKFIVQQECIGIRRRGTSIYETNQPIIFRYSSAIGGNDQSADSELQAGGLDN